MSARARQWPSSALTDALIVVALVAGAARYGAYYDRVNTGMHLVPDFTGVDGHGCIRKGAAKTGREATGLLALSDFVAPRPQTFHEVNTNLGHRRVAHFAASVHRLAHLSK